MGFGGFYKGEKKKQKKGKDGKGGSSYSTAPVFTLPDLIPKKKKDSNN